MKTRLFAITVVITSLFSSPAFGQLTYYEVFGRGFRNDVRDRSGSLRNDGIGLPNFVDGEFDLVGIIRLPKSEDYLALTPEQVFQFSEKEQNYLAEQLDLEKRLDHFRLVGDKESAKKVVNELRSLRQLHEELLRRLIRDMLLPHQFEKAQNFATATHFQLGGGLENPILLRKLAIDPATLSELKTELKRLELQLANSIYRLRRKKSEELIQSLPPDKAAAVLDILGEPPSYMKPTTEER